MQILFCKIIGAPVCYRQKPDNDRHWYFFCADNDKYSYYSAQIMTNEAIFLRGR